ncbi:uncharacterized protein LOC144440284 isoform X2 [Glandiceps talaboti]
MLRSLKVSIPYHARQVGPIYFKTPRKIQIFGVCNEAIPLQVNYLLAETDTIGVDGTGCHGPDTVISLLHHYFEKHCMGEKGANLIADNCGGQNKNRYVIAYLAWRCMTGLHETITLSFTIPGHTRCLVDGCFGILKRRYRQSDCDTLSQLAATVDVSARCYKAQLFRSEAGVQQWQWYNWKGFLERHFKGLPGIRKLQYFRFTAEEPGTVYVKQQMDDPETKLELLKRNTAPVDVQGMPDILAPGGMSQQRQLYLYNYIREHVWTPHKDVTSPAPYIDEQNLFRRWKVNK